MANIGKSGYGSGSSSNSGSSGLGNISSGSTAKQASAPKKIDNGPVPSVTRVSAPTKAGTSNPYGSNSNGAIVEDRRKKVVLAAIEAVSYTHLTLPTNREV